MFSILFCVFVLQYGSDEFPQDSPVGSTRYASPKAGGALYQQPEPFFDSTSGTWYSSSSAYAPQSSATTYHHMGHSPHLGPPHAHDHYSLSPGTHDGHIQVSAFFFSSHFQIIFCFVLFCFDQNIFV